jgi:hypothetical protein
MKRFELDKHKEEIIRLYMEEQLSCSEVARRTGAHLCGIYDALRRWGIKTRNLSQSHREYTVDENYFDIIDNEEKAYWLGFIYADGYITSPHAIGLALSIDDKGHIIKFQRSLKSNHPLHDYVTDNDYGRSKYSRLLVLSKPLFEQLQGKGVVLRKSLVLTYPDESILPEKLNRHFIRGYFDGDGSIVLSKNSINFKICGTREFLGKLITIFNENSTYKFQNKLFKRKYDDKNNYYISYGGKYKIFSVLSYLYEDSTIFLDRKMIQYKKLKDLFNSK